MNARRALRGLAGVVLVLFGAYCAFTAGVLFLSAAFDWNNIDLNRGGKAQLGVLFAFGALICGWVAFEVFRRRPD